MNVPIWPAIQAAALTVLAIFDGTLAMVLGSRVHNLLSIGLGLAGLLLGFALVLAVALTEADWRNDAAEGKRWFD